MGTLFEGIITSKTRIKFCAVGRDTGIVDLLLVGNIDLKHLADLSNKTERYIKRKIRLLVFTAEDFAKFLPSLRERPQILIWDSKRSLKSTPAEFDWG
jgi:hypothetical protein